MTWSVYFESIDLIIAYCPCLFFLSAVVMNSLQFEIAVLAKQFRKLWDAGFVGMEILLPEILQIILHRAITDTCRVETRDWTVKCGMDNRPTATFCYLNQVV